MKKIILLLFLGSLPHIIYAEKREKAFACPNGTKVSFRDKEWDALTLYFVYDEKTYERNKEYTLYKVFPKGEPNCDETKYYYTFDESEFDAETQDRTQTTVKIINIYPGKNESYKIYTNFKDIPYREIGGNLKGQPWRYGDVGNLTSCIVFTKSFENCNSSSYVGWFRLNDRDDSMPNLTKVIGGRFVNTSNANDMDSMFGYCRNLEYIDVSTWLPEGNKVASLHAIFLGTKIRNLDVGNWDVSLIGEDNDSRSVIIRAAFSEMEFLETIEVRNWNTSKVEDMTYAFYGCSKLKSITFGKNFSTVKNPSKNYMFAECPKLRYLDFYDSDHTAAITSVERNSENNMFSGVPATTVIYLPKMSTDVTDKTNVVYSNNGDADDLRCPRYYSSDPMSLAIPSGYTHSQVQTDVEIPRDFQTNEAVYVRTMPAGATIGTAILPYEFASNDSIQAYRLIGENATQMRFESTGLVPANTPFVFKVKQPREDGTAHFRMTDATGQFGITVHKTVGYEESGKALKDTDFFETDDSFISYNGWTARGYYVTQTVNDYADAFYINTAGTKFCQATGPLTLNPHRVTFHGAYNHGDGSAKTFGVQFVDLPTAIETADLHETVGKAEAVYDLQGRRMSALPSLQGGVGGRPGINIVRMSDGTVKKVIIK